MTARPGWRPANVYVPQLVDLAVLREQLAEYMARPLLTEGTVVQYKACLDRFRRWCERRRLSPFPTTPQVLGAWLAAALSGAARVDLPGTAEESDEGAPAPLTMGTVDQTWAALAWWHRSPNMISPTEDTWVRT